MARYRYVILNQAKPGREEEFRTWYRDQHLADVRRHEGIVSAELYDVVHQKDYDLDLPSYCLMTVYEMETDDPVALVEAIKARSGSADMPATDAIEKSGMIQAVGTLIASA